MAEPNLAAESKRLVAKLRSFSGNHAPTALAFAGNVGASPMPNRNRGREEAAETRAEGCRKGRDAPNDRADAPDPPDTEAIEHYANGDLAERVCPVIRAQQQAVGEVGDAEGLVEALVRNRQVDAVEVVDEDAESQ